MNQGGEDRFEIAFFDVETTVPTRTGQGFSLLEFGSILVCPRKLIELQSYSTLIRPADLNSINSLSVRCNGITRDAVIAAPSFDEIADRVFDILHGRIWAGHNILRFDCPWIREAFAHIGRPAPEPKGTIDSLALLTQRFGRRAGNMKMATLATYFGLGQQTHRSLDDVRMNLEVLKYCATVLFLESSLPDILTENSWISPNATTRSRSGGKLSPEGSSVNMNISNQTGNNHPVTSFRTDTVETTQEVSALLETVESSINQPDSFDMGPLIDEVKKELDQQDINMVEIPAQESPNSSFDAAVTNCNATMELTSLRTDTVETTQEVSAFRETVESSINRPDPFEMGPLIDEVKKELDQQDINMVETPAQESPNSSFNAAVTNNCNATTEFLQLDQVFVPSISASLVLLHHGGQRIKLLHKDATLQLCCSQMKLRFGINTNFFDHAGRPRLNIVFDAPPKLCEVLDACDGLAQKVSVESGSSSEWRPVVIRKEGFYSYPTVRLHIPTTVCGELAIYATEIYRREPSGTEQRLVFSKFDASELSALFTRGMLMDVFFSLDPYDYQQSAGISKKMAGQAKSKNSGTSIDRIRVKILLCDPDAESCEEVSTLLTACSYQVISVSSAVKVVDALNAEWPSIDIILAAVDLPLESSIAMLKYIMQDRHFKFIPVIMLSTNHESSFLLNFLRLGATDYLVKPLRMDEILNLWMHSCRQPKVLDWLPQNNFQTSGEENNNIFVCNDPDEEFLANTMQTLCVLKRS